MKKIIFRKIEKESDDKLSILTEKKEKMISAK